MKKEKLKQAVMLVPFYLWVICITVGGYLLEIESSWVFSAMVPMFFLMSGEIKEKILTVVGGAVNGLVMSYLLCIIVSALSGIIGPIWGWIIPVSLVIAALMLLRPFFPYFCNSVAFLYMIIATKDADEFFAQFGSLMLWFAIGGIIYLGGILLIGKALQILRKKKKTS